jgi:hypothetical protein
VKTRYSKIVPCFVGFKPRPWHKTGMIVSIKFPIKLKFKMMNVIKAFLAGLTIGILFAPQSGEKTRKRLGKVFKDYKEDAKDYVADAIGTAENKIHRAKKTVQEL